MLLAQGNWTDPHNHYTFLGKEWDEHLGLYEFGVRLYDPWAGGWLTREPLPGDAGRPRTWHRYAYAFANPISYYDPYGLQGLPVTPVPMPTPPPYTPTPGPLPTSTATPTPRPLPTPALMPAPRPVPTAPRAPTPTIALAPAPTGAQCPPAYSPRESVVQAWSLVYEWFFEVGPAVRTFGPEYAITQDIMHDPGIAAFRRAWAEAGYPVPWEWRHSADVRTGGWLPVRMVQGGLVYAREHLVELPLSTGLGVLGLGPNDPRSPIDPVGGIIGSLDKIYVWPSEQEGWVRIEVVNVNELAIRDSYSWDRLHIDRPNYATRPGDCSELGA